MSYGTIVADPPWRYNKTSGLPTNAIVSKPEAEQQYPTMSVEDICVLRPDAAKDAHLYLWVTNPLLFDAYPVLEAWGFRYITLLTWHKLGAMGMGFYFRGDTEHVIFGVRGNAPIPPPIRMSNHFSVHKTGHSIKPDYFYEMVERVSPEPRLEMFARTRRIGWDVWGNQAPPEADARTQLHMSLSA